MTKGQFALVAIIGFILLVAVGLLIAASVQGMNIVEMFQSWFKTAEETPPEEVVETSKIVLNLLKI